MLNIDGVDYNVGCNKITRSTILNEKYNVKTLNGTTVREINNVSNKFTLEIVNVDETDYQAVFELFSQPVAEHIVKYPYGINQTKEIRICVKSVQDGLITRTKDGLFWSGMTIESEVQPQIAN